MKIVLLAELVLTSVRLALSLKVIFVIDCPPIELVADTQIIEKLADRTIFVIRAGLLERSMLEMCIRDSASRFPMGIEKPRALYICTSQSAHPTVSEETPVSYTHLDVYKRQG